jgi:hypothetical protein
MTSWRRWRWGTQPWLADDYWTVARISVELSEADPELVAETFSLMAAPLAD